MTKSTLLQFYSIVKIVKAKDLPQLSKTYKDSQERLLVMFKKKPETPDDKMPTWFKKWSETILEPRLKKIEDILERNKIDGILERNNLN